MALATGAYMKSQTGSRRNLRKVAGRGSPGGGISTCSCAANATVANTRRIGCARLVAEYCATAPRPGYPQSQNGALRTVRDAKRWTATAARLAEAATKPNSSRPLYELRLADTGTMDSQGMLACGGICPATSV